MFFHFRNALKSCRQYGTIDFASWKDGRRARSELPEDPDHEYHPNFARENQFSQVNEQSVRSERGHERGDWTNPSDKSGSQERKFSEEGKSRSRSERDKEQGGWNDHSDESGEGKAKFREREEESGRPQVRIVGDDTKDSSREWMDKIDEMAEKAKPSSGEEKKLPSGKVYRSKLFEKEEDEAKNYEMYKN